MYIDNIKYYESYNKIYV